MCLNLSVVRHICVSDRHTIAVWLASVSPAAASTCWGLDFALTRAPGRNTSAPSRSPASRARPSASPRASWEPASSLPLWVRIYFPESAWLYPCCQGSVHTTRLCLHNQAQTLSALLGSVHTVWFRPHRPTPSIPSASVYTTRVHSHCWAPSTLLGSLHTPKFCLYCWAPLNNAQLHRHNLSPHCSYKMPHCPHCLFIGVLFSAAIVISVLSTLTSVHLCSSLIVCKRSVL